jgi:hypothetical protein
MFILEDENFLKDNQKIFLDNILNNKNFPFYWQNQTTLNQSVKSGYGGAFMHTLMRRKEDRKEDELYNSEYSKDFEDILKQFCSNNNIKCNEIFRMSVNLTYNNGLTNCEIHKDHNFSHKQLLIYLNDPLDKESKTVLLDNNNNKIKEIVPKKFKGVCFENTPHFHYFPKIGERIVVVYTFN